MNKIYRFAGVALACAGLLCATGASASAFIDDFGEYQKLSIFGDSIEETVSGMGIIGGSRDSTLTSSTAATIANMITESPAGLIMQAFNPATTLTLVYDGVGNPGGGLGGIALQSAMNRGIRLVLTDLVGMLDFNIEIKDTDGDIDDVSRTVSNVGSGRVDILWGEFSPDIDLHSVAVVTATLDLSNPTGSFASLAATKISFIPEPLSLLLFASGLGGLAGTSALRRRRKSPAKS